MKLFGSSLIAQGIRAAGVGAVLMLSLSASYAQSGPFAGFNGVWSGNGTVALSDGTTERIRCKADYKVDGTGLGLKQNLRCAARWVSVSECKDQTIPIQPWLPVISEGSMPCASDTLKPSSIIVRPFRS